MNSTSDLVHATTELLINNTEHYGKQPFPPPCIGDRLSDSLSILAMCWERVFYICSVEITFLSFLLQTDIMRCFYCFGLFWKFAIH